MIKIFIRYLKWLINGKPMIKYSGYTCGCCGKFREDPFEIPEYDSNGEYWDTIGLCSDKYNCVSQKKKDY